MKYYFSLLFCLTGLTLTAQQSFSVTASGKTIEFDEIHKLSIVGYAGSDLKIETANNRSRKDDRARGLRKINARGLVDNTGFGLSATAEGDRILVRQVGSGDNSITVKVPNTAIVKIVQTTNRGSNLSISDFEGELDVSMQYNDVNLSNTYGPLAVNVVYGNIAAEFADKAPTQDARLHSSYGSVDVTLPASTKADLRLSTSYGDMYTDFDIVIGANTKRTKESGSKEDCNCESNRSGLTGTINGGGPLLALSATYDDIYLRKK